MTGVEITDATHADQELIADLITQLWVSDGGPKPDPAFARARAASIYAHYTPVVFREAGEPVGYAAYRESGDYVFIRHFVLDLQHRGRGLGPKLFDALEADRFAGRQTKLDATTNVPEPRAFWESMGFKVTGFSLEREGTTA